MLQRRGSERSLMLQRRGSERSLMLQRRGSERSLMLQRRGSERSLMLERRGSEGSLMLERRGSERSLMLERRGSEGSLMLEGRGSERSLMLERRGSERSLILQRRGSERSLMLQRRGSERSLMLQRRGSEDSLMLQRRGSERSLMLERRGSEGSLMLQRRGSEGSLILQRGYEVSSSLSSQQQMGGEATSEPLSAQLSALERIHIHTNDTRNSFVSHKTDTGSLCSGESTSESGVSGRNPNMKNNKNGGSSKQRQQQQQRLNQSVKTQLMEEKIEYRRSHGNYGGIREPGNHGDKINLHFALQRPNACLPVAGLSKHGKILHKHPRLSRQPQGAVAGSLLDIPGHDMACDAKLNASLGSLDFSIMTLNKDEPQHQFNTSVIEKADQSGSDLPQKPNPHANENQVHDDQIDDDVFGANTNNDTNNNTSNEEQNLFSEGHESARTFMWFV